jgi:hypothetical protein
MDVDALVSGVFSVIVGSVFLFLGYRLSGREVPGRARLAAAQFALFWLGFAAVTYTGAILSLIAVVQVPSSALVTTATHTEVLLLCAALWGLLGYLTYLYTARYFIVAWSAFYIGLYLFLSFVITASEPKTVSISHGMVSLTYGTVFGGVLLDGLLIVLIAPEFIGALLYLTLAFRTKEPTVRFRAGLVSGGLLLWFGLASINLTTLLGGSLGAALASESLGLVAALLILLAYYPPRSVRERFHVGGIGPSATSPPGPISP